MYTLFIKLLIPGKLNLKKLFSRWMTYSAQVLISQIRFFINTWKICAQLVCRPRAVCFAQPESNQVSLLRNIPMLQCNQTSTGPLGRGVVFLSWVKNQKCSTLHCQGVYQSIDHEGRAYTEWHGMCHPESTVQLLRDRSVSIFKTMQVSGSSLAKQLEKCVLSRLGEKLEAHALILPRLQLCKNPLLRAPKSMPYSLPHLDYCYPGQVL